MPCLSFEATKWSLTLEGPYGILEESQTIRFSMRTATGPAGMVEWINVPFGVRHQAKDSSRGIAKTGDTTNGAIGVRGECLGRLSRGIDITKHDLAACLKRGKSRRIGQKLAFPMSRREFD